MSYPYNLNEVWGIPEGRVRSMGGSHMGKVVKIINRITVPIILTVPIKYFLTLGLIKTSFISNSLTERARQV